MGFDLTFEDMEQFRIGIDLGGTKTEAILLDPDGVELYRERVPTPRDENVVYQDILQIVHKLVLNQVKEVPAGREYTVGIGVPGSIDPETHRIIKSNATSLNGTPFKQDLESLLGRTIGMDNDANCFTLAESRQGAAKGYRFVFGVIMGTGCGGGLCIDGHIRQGRNGVTGEWGHMSIDPLGIECFCGNRGCIETKISGTGLSKNFTAKYGLDLTAEQVLEGHSQGDMRCTDIYENFLDDFGRCIGGLISIIDPDAIVLGGGLSNIEDLYNIGVDRVRRYSFQPDIDTPILKNQLGDSAGVLGAAWIGT